MERTGVRLQHTCNVKIKSGDANSGVYITRSKRGRSRQSGKDIWLYDHVHVHGQILGVGYSECHIPREKLPFQVLNVAYFERHSP